MTFPHFSTARTNCDILSTSISIVEVPSMGHNDKIQLFENKRIRTAWDEEKEE